MAAAVGVLRPAGAAGDGPAVERARVVGGDRPVVVAAVDVDRLHPLDRVALGVEVGEHGDEVVGLRRHDDEPAGVDAAVEPPVRDVEGPELLDGHGAPGSPGRVEVLRGDRGDRRGERGRWCRGIRRAGDRGAASGRRGGPVVGASREPTSTARRWWSSRGRRGGVGGRGGRDGAGRGVVSPTVGPRTRSRWRPAPPGPVRADIASVKSRTAPTPVVGPRG